MSGCAKGVDAEQLQGISAARYRQNCPQHYPQTQCGDHSTPIPSPGGIIPFRQPKRKPNCMKGKPMTKTKTQLPDPDEAIRERVLARAKTLNAEIIDRLRIAADDLEAGEHRAALGALDGIEAQLTIIRSVLLLLS